MPSATRRILEYIAVLYGLLTCTRWSTVTTRRKHRRVGLEMQCGTDVVKTPHDLASRPRSCRHDTVEIDTASVPIRRFGASTRASR